MGTAALRSQTVLVAIPCFNEELAIGSLVLRARAFAAEVLVIDDGSSDQTAIIADRAGATVLQNPGNRGKGYSVRRAFEYAAARNVDCIVLMDGDGQHDPNEIPLIVAPLVSGAEPVDIALGIRFGERTEMPAWRKFGKRALDYTTAMVGGTDVVDSQMGFRAFGRNAIRELAPRFTTDGFGIESETLIHAKSLGLRSVNVPMNCKYDGLDGSTQAPIRHALGVVRSILVLVGEQKPLVFLGLPAVVSFVTGIVLGGYVLATLIQHGRLQVGSAVLSSLLLLAGILSGFAALILHVIPRSIERSMGRRNTVRS